MAVVHDFAALQLEPESNLGMHWLYPYTGSGKCRLMRDASQKINKGLGRVGLNPPEQMLVKLEIFPNQGWT